MLKKIIRLSKLTSFLPKKKDSLPEAIRDYMFKDAINRFNPFTFLCLSQAMTWISNVKCPICVW